MFQIQSAEQFTKATERAGASNLLHTSSLSCRSLWAWGCVKVRFNSLTNAKTATQASSRTSIDSNDAPGRARSCDLLIRSLIISIISSFQRPSLNHANHYTAMVCSCRFVSFVSVVVSDLSGFCVPFCVPFCVWNLRG